jgi:hypothetical protein
MNQESKPSKYLSEERHANGPLGDPDSQLVERLQWLLDRSSSQLESELRVVQQHLDLATLKDALLVSMDLSTFLFREVGKGNRIFIQHSSGIRSELIVKSRRVE